MDEQNSEKGLKNNKAFIISVVVAVFLVLGAGIYWLLQKDGNSKNTLTSLVQDKQEENKPFEWTNYISDDQHFKIDYPDNWKVLDDESLYFGAALYGESQDTEALIKIRKIEAINKAGLQEVLDDEYKTCTEEKEDCSVVDIEELTVIKISGEKSRIDTDSKYLSGTTIYMYMKDYYLSVYLEYENDDYLPVFEKMVDSIFVDIESRYKHYYCNREPNKILYHNSLPGYCHTVEFGDTLWSIAERYYGNPYMWEQINLYEGDAWDLTLPDPEDPKVLSLGTSLRIWYAFSFSDNDKVAGGTSGGWGLDTDTGDIYTTDSGKIYINNEIYDQGFGRVYRFLVDERTNNKIYIVSPKKEEGESRNNFWLYQFIFNKQRNPYIGPGGDFELITFNHDEDKYALRINARHAVPDPGFIALSNIGNGPEFDYLDSLIWYDNDTLVYRAQNNDEWRLVINHEDYETYDYIENLRLEDGVIKFDARDKNNKWTEEELLIEDEAYNARLVSIPDEAPVGEEFFTYLKNTRSDLSEADLFRIEKNYHYKKGTLVDEFGNLVEDSVELYLDPVPDIGMSEDAGRITFTAENGRFELFVYEIGSYTLSLQEGWSAPELEEINSVDFRYSGSDYKMTVSNEEYDKKARAKYTYEAEDGDTLLSMSDRYYGYKYYWPLIVENNDLDSSDGMLVISKGDELYIPPFSEFDREKLNELRMVFHEENTEEVININNDDFSYSIDYPECWEIGSTENNEYNDEVIFYNRHVHKQWIMGPEYPKESSGKYYRKPFIILWVHDNRVSMGIEEFALYNHITDQRIIDEGNFITEKQDNGGILITSGYYGGKKHLVFFKDDLIYDVAREYHHSMDPVSQQESLDIVNSFRFID